MESIGGCSSPLGASVAFSATLERQCFGWTLGIEVEVGCWKLGRLLCTL